MRNGFVEERSRIIGVGILDMMANENQGVCKKRGQITNNICFMSAKDLGPIYVTFNPRCRHVVVPQKLRSVIVS